VVVEVRPIDRLDVPGGGAYGEQAIVEQVEVERHNALAAWRTEARQHLELVRLTNQEVLRELVGLLLTDETVARRLRGRLIDVAKEGRRD
jgi:DNA-directed RNA polymerase subunit F